MSHELQTLLRAFLRSENYFKGSSRIKILKKALLEITFNLVLSNINYNFYHFPENSMTVE